MHKLLSVPVPLFLGALQVEAPSFLDGAPGYVVGFVAAIWVVFYVLDKLGRLPKNGSNGELAKAIDRLSAKIDAYEPSFSEDDRRALNKTANLLAQRDDDGFERLLVMARQVRETSERAERIEDQVRVQRGAQP